MSDLPQISEAEFEVMKIVWKHAPISTNEITDKLLQTTSWSPKTIQTLIKRLVNKGVLTYEKQSRVFVYTPVVKESEYIGQESNSFLERYYDGDITAMLSAYIENDRLSETEIDIRQFIPKGESPVYYQANFEISKVTGDSVYITYHTEEPVSHPYLLYKRERTEVTENK